MKPKDTVYVSWSFWKIEYKYDEKYLVREIKANRDRFLAGGEESKREMQ